MRASPSSGDWTSCCRTTESTRSQANSGCTARRRGNRRHAERSVRHRQLGNPAHPRRGTRRCDCHHQLTTAGPYRGTVDGNPGVMGYIASKHGVVGLMRAWTNPLALERIRVNTVHPTGVNWSLFKNQSSGRFVQEFPTIAANLQNPLPAENGLIQPEDVTNTILHLVSDTGRYITGSAALVDAGFPNK